MSTESPDPSTSSDVSAATNCLITLANTTEENEERLDRVSDILISQQEDIEELEKRIANLTEQIEALESMFRPSMVEKATSHVQAQKSGDPREMYDVGDICQVRIDDPPGEGRDPSVGVGRLQGIVTFVEPNGIDITSGSIVEVSITDRKKRALEAEAKRIV